MTDIIHLTKEGLETEFIVSNTRTSELELKLHKKKLFQINNDSLTIEDIESKFLASKAQTLHWNLMLQDRKYLMEKYNFLREAVHFANIAAFSCEKAAIEEKSIHLQNAKKAFNIVNDFYFTRI